jgi:hypothetical protein
VVFYVVDSCFTGPIRHSLEEVLGLAPFTSFKSYHIHVFFYFFILDKKK